MGYSRRTSNYSKRIKIFDLNHMISMTNLVANIVETLRIYNGYSLEKEFNKLICMNPLMVLYLIINQVNVCHSRVCGYLTRDTKDILWMDDYVLIMTYESLDT